MVRQQRQRQAAAEARLAEQTAESAARQRKAARIDAVSAYRTLLAEVVRDAGASFSVWQPKLVKDPLVRVLDVFCIVGGREGGRARGVCHMANVVHTAWTKGVGVSALPSVGDGRKALNVQGFCRYSALPRLLFCYLPVHLWSLSIT